MHYPHKTEPSPVDASTPARVAARDPARPLRTADFRRVAENGFGDGANSYAYSAAWFDDNLFVGSNRHIVPLLIMRSPFSFAFTIPPVPVPEDHTALDLRGQIWRYSVRDRTWTRAYHAPLIPGYQGRMIAQAFGFRGMTVFQGTSDARPALYTVPTVGRHALETITLRSPDGVNFEVLPAPRVKGSSQSSGSFRAMMAFKGRLFVAPSASKPPPEAARVENGRAVYVTLSNTSLESAVLVSSDPASGEWELSSPPLFGDPTNTSIIDMAVCGDFLYVGTLNVRYGFQLWRTDGEGPAPHRWELVLDRGADRGALNQAVLSMAEFQGDLYVGTCIQNGGFDKVYQIGPAAGEVLRVRQDGTWDLIVGDPRITRQGLKIPTSGLRSGFNNPLCCYIWRMCAHDGALYVGTCDNSSFAQFSPPENWPPHIRRVLDADTMDKYMETAGGCELWRTTDGDNWLPVTRNGFGNRYNLGVRALVSTPRGLFVGTANPFGPQVAVRDGSGWKYQDNPRGGLEIWHGSHEHHAEASSTLPFEFPDGEIAPVQRNGACPSSSAPDRESSELEQAGLSQNYVMLERALAKSDIARNPFLRLASEPADLAGLSESVEEEIATYFGGPLRNMGYWRLRSLTPAEACEALVRELAAFLPDPKQGGESRSILCVGLGAEALAATLEDRFAGCSLVAVAPDDWPPMDERSYDAAIGVEAGSRLERSVVLERLAWVLKPGGCAVLSECLAASTVERATPAAVFAREANLAGLVVEETRDVTAKTWAPFNDNSRTYCLVKLLLQQIDAEKKAAILAALPGGNSGLDSYMFFRLKKPENT